MGSPPAGPQGEGGQWVSWAGHVRTGRLSGGAVERGARATKGKLTTPPLHPPTNPPTCRPAEASSSRMGPLSASPPPAGWSRYSAVAGARHGWMEGVSKWQPKRGAGQRHRLQKAWLRCPSRRNWLAGWGQPSGTHPQSAPSAQPVACTSRRGRRAARCKKRWCLQGVEQQGSSGQAAAGAGAARVPPACSRVGGPAQIPTVPPAHRSRAAWR